MKMMTMNEKEKEKLPWLGIIFLVSCGMCEIEMGRGNNNRWVHLAKDTGIDGWETRPRKIMKSFKTSEWGNKKGSS